MNKADLIREQYPDSDLILIEGFDDCIMGIVEKFNSLSVLYDLEKVLNKLESQGMDRSDAQDWYDYNMNGAWLGECTPSFFIQLEDDS